MLLVRVLSVLLVVRLALSQVSGAMELLVDPEATELLMVQARYENQTAVYSRLNNHFFCIDRSTTPTMNGDGDVDVTFTEFEQNNASVWTLFFQFPALAYLDPARKIALLTLVLNTLNELTDAPPGSAYPPTTSADLCIGTFEFYKLTTFDESVLIHLYARGNQPFVASAISNQFELNVAEAYMDSQNSFVIQYPEQSNDVMAFNLSAMMQLQDILLPPRMTEDTADPTMLAVYLGSFGTNVSLSELEDMDMINYDRFAQNPNPVNYGLEAGDIVFAVFGGLLLALVGFLIILGYCIHPFWLA